MLLAQLVRQQRVNAHVEYHSFALQESHDGDLPVPFPDDYEQDVFLNGFPGRLDFYSGGHTHTATVIVEVWDGPPPAREASAWDEQGEAEFESASGEVAVWSGSVGRTETFALGSPGPWHVRAYCVGRAEAAALSEGEGTDTTWRGTSCSSGPPRDRGTGAAAGCRPAHPWPVSGADQHEEPVVHPVDDAVPRVVTAQELPPA